MAIIFAWILFGLGIGHIVFGLFKFKTPISEAISAGFIGQFQTPEIRRTAFWFLIGGPLLMLIGHIAIHAATTGDLEVLKIIGIYLFVMSVIGVTAFPKSPILTTLILSPFFIAIGYGLLR